MSLTDRYVLRFGAEAAPRVLARDLMRGNPAEYKVGYTDENAVLAVVDLFGLTEERGDELLREIRVDVLAEVLAND